MQGIAINGTKLHEIQMLMVPNQNGTISRLSYPKSEIHFALDGEEIRLSFPAVLALELYRSGILPQNSQEKFSVSISGKKVGDYRVTDFRYPRYGDNISMVISKEPAVLPL